MKLIGLRADRECYDAENVLKQAGVKFDYIDIGASAENMKLFIALRDHRQEFDKIKEQGFVGLPCFVLDDDTILFDENEIIRHLEEQELEESISA